jgi:hypothetical protein
VSRGGGGRGSWIASTGNTPVVGGRCEYQSVAVLVASIVLLLGGGRAVAAGGPVPRCHTDDLAASLSRFGAGLGNVSTQVALRNRSGHVCFVYGYPGFGLQDTHRRVQPSRVRWGSTYFQVDRRPYRVVLRPGGQAYSNLAWGDNPGPGESLRGPCEPVSAWLEVTPPDERAYVLVRFGQRVCGHGSMSATALSASAEPPGA